MGSPAGPGQQELAHVGEIIKQNAGSLAKDIIVYVRIVVTGLLGALILLGSGWVIEYVVDSMALPLLERHAKWKEWHDWVKLLWLTVVSLYFLGDTIQSLRSHQRLVKKTEREVGL